MFAAMTGAGVLLAGIIIGGGVGAIIGSFKRRILRASCSASSWAAWAGSSSP